MSENQKTIYNSEDFSSTLNSEESLTLCEGMGYTFDDIKNLARRKKELSKELDEIDAKTKEIKQALLTHKIKSADFGGTVLSITIQNKDTLDEQKLVELLKQKGLNQGIIIKQVPNPEMLPELIANGLITDTELSSCIVPNRVPVLNFPREKKSKVSNTVEKVIKSTNKSKMF